MESEILVGPDTTGRHAFIVIEDQCIKFEISNGGGYGSEPYGHEAVNEGGSFTVESAWRRVERVLIGMDVETTEVRDDREEQCTPA